MWGAECSEVTISVHSEVCPTWIVGKGTVFSALWMPGGRIEAYRNRNGMFMSVAQADGPMSQLERIRELRRPSMKAQGRVVLRSMHDLDVLPGNFPDSGSQGFRNRFLRCKASS